jgi:hypothetical protein
MAAILRASVRRAIVGLMPFASLALKLRDTLSDHFKSGKNYHFKTGQTRMPSGQWVFYPANDRERKLISSVGGCLPGALSNKQLRRMQRRQGGPHRLHGLRRTAVRSVQFLKGIRSHVRYYKP